MRLLRGKSRYLTKMDNLCLLLYFIAAFAYMPTSRPSDRNVCVITFVLLVFNTGVNVFFKKWEIKSDKSLGMYILLVLWGGFSCLWSQYTDLYNVYLMMDFPIIVISVLCLGVYLQSEDDIDRIMYIIIFSGCVAAIRFLYYTPWDLMFSNNYYTRGTFGSLLDDITNYNNYTTHLCIICIIAVYYAIIKRVKICYITFAFLFAVLIFAGSRKNMVVVPLIAVYFAFMSGSLKGKFKAILAIVALLLVAWYFFMTVDFLESIREKFFDMFSGIFSESDTQIQTDTSTKMRLKLISEARSVWGDNFFFGVGWNNFRYMSSSGLYAHNTYLELLSTLGVVGFFIYYYCYIKVLWEYIKNHKHSNWEILTVGIIVAFLVLEYGAITLYCRERMMLLLLVFLVNNVASKKNLVSNFNR